MYLHMHPGTTLKGGCVWRASLAELQDLMGAALVWMFNIAQAQIQSTCKTALPPSSRPSGAYR